MRTRPLKKVKDLTVREHFAGLALQGLLSAGNNSNSLVERAVKIADKLIEELNKTDNEPHS